MSGQFTTDNAREAQAESAKTRRAKALERHIQRVLDTAPPIPPERRAELAALLAPPSTEDGVA